MARTSSTTGDAELDALLATFVEELPERDRKLALEIVVSALRLAKDQVNSLDRKIVNATLKELRYAFKVFAPYKDVRKVSIFGSARTGREDPEFSATREFSRLIAEHDWMVITGAGPGIMEAGHEGAGGERSFGANIRLPFEAKPNVVIADDAKLINFKYFFTRKLTFMKEADAFVCLPGGFGTLDEAFELLTLVQTGKAALHPIVLLDHAGGTYWDRFEAYLNEELLGRGYISEDDLSLFRSVKSPEAAVDEIMSFYRIYHSSRLVGDRFVMRLTQTPAPQFLEELSETFSDILSGPIEVVGPSKIEHRDDDVTDLARISLTFDRQHVGRLRQLIDHLNARAPVPTQGEG